MPTTAIAAIIGATRMISDLPLNRVIAALSAWLPRPGARPRQNRNVEDHGHTKHGFVLLRRISLQKYCILGSIFAIPLTGNRSANGTVCRVGTNRARAAPVRAPAHFRTVRGCDAGPPGSGWARRGPIMTDELDRLERRAQEVRGQLALDLDELFVRLQPRRLVRSVGVYARDREAGGDLGRDIVRDMRHKPVPYLLVGIGIAGLVWAVSSFSRAPDTRAFT